MSNSFEAVLGTVRGMQMSQHASLGRVFKYIIFSRANSITGERIWGYRQSPCPGCNPSNQIVGFAREVFGTVWYCKKHQQVWDEIMTTWAEHMIPRQRNTPNYGWPKGPGPDA